MTPTGAEVRRGWRAGVIASGGGPQQRMGLRGEPAWILSGGPDSPPPPLSSLRGVLPASGGCRVSRCWMSSPPV
ncbi:hypothetical protein NN561_008871 [Cricetulus griseus]